MSGGRLPTLHAIFTVAGDVDLLRAALAAIYPDVAGITVVTGYDRDWAGRARDPGGLAELVLGRAGDPERKVGLVIFDETNEARTRNRAMDLAAPPRRSLAVAPQPPPDRPLAVPDYFLVVDADEIYPAGALERLRRHVALRRLPAYRVACARYFRSWNHRVAGLEWMTALVRADVRLHALRNVRTPLARRALARVPGLPAGARARLARVEDVPAQVALFHHGSYVGPRERIAAKIASFGHATEVRPRWMEEVWDRFHPGARDLNPVYPGLFPAVERVATADLPREIRDWPWPPGYLDPPP